METSASMTAPILQVEHLSMKFGGLIAIGDLSFQAKRGEITALIGPNGAGKTTVFNCITGFYKPSEGMILLNRRDGASFMLERLPNHEIPARAKVARTFQNIRLFSGMTVLENLLVAQHNKLMKASGFTVLGLLGIGGYAKAATEAVELARFWLEKADLIDRADDPAGDLPYGAQRRLEIARAMCINPELLCLDEPAAGLNPKESQALNALLIDIKNSTGTSILLIEHDMSVVMQISDHVVVLEYGRKISDGNPDSVKNDPRVIAAYLGVDDEEVGDVLAEVGDEQIIDQFDGTADRAHGPGTSSSMMAGSISDTIGHSDHSGERVTVAAGASKAVQIDRKSARAKAPPAKATPAKSATADKAASARVVATMTAPTKAAKSAASTQTPTAMASAVAPNPALPAKPAAPAKATPTKAAAPPKAVAPARAGKPAKPKPTPEPKAALYGMARTVKPAASLKTPPPAEPKASGKAAASSKPKAELAAFVPAAPDRLILIKGIGPVNERKLNEHGIFRFAEIAAWKKADIAAVEAYLAFDGRIAREDWIGQAKALAKAAAKPAKRGGAK